MPIGAGDEHKGSAGFNLHVKLDPKTKAMMRKLKSVGEIKGRDIDKIAGRFIRGERKRVVIPAVAKATGLTIPQARRRVRVPSKKTTKRRHGFAGYVIETWGSAQVVHAGHLRITKPPRGSRKGSGKNAGLRESGLTIAGKWWKFAKIVRGRKYGRDKRRRVYRVEKGGRRHLAGKAISDATSIPKTYNRLRPIVYRKYGKRMKREITVLVQKRFKSV